LDQLPANLSKQILESRPEFGHDGWVGQSKTTIFVGIRGPIIIVSLDYVSKAILYCYLVIILRRVCCWIKLWIFE